MKGEKAAFLYDEASPETVKTIRFFLWALWITLLSILPLSTMHYFPSDAYRPTGFLLSLFPDIIPLFVKNPAGFYILHWLTLTFGLLSMLHFRKYVFGPLFLGSLILHRSLFFSIGHAGHSELVPLYGVMIFVFSDIAGLFSSDKDRQSEVNGRFALQLWLLLFCFTYSMIGLHRLVVSGSELFSPDSMKSWILFRVNQMERFWTPVARMLLGQDSLMQLLDMGYPLMTAIEIAAPIALISRRFRILFFPVMAVFHLLTWVTINIKFWESVFLLLLILDVDRWLKPRPAEKPPLIYFDGVCGLCNRFVDWLLPRDRLAIFKFTTLQDADIKDDNELLDSVRLKDDGQVYKRSEAVFRIFDRLGGLYRIASLLRFLPRGLCDSAYDFIAANRYRWFGKRSTCRIPTASERSRFVS